MDLPQQHPGLGHGTGSGTFSSPYGPLRTSNTAGGYPNAIHSTFDMNPTMGYGPTIGGAGEIGGPYGYGHAAAGGGGGAYGLPSPPGGQHFGVESYQAKASMLNSSSRDGTYSKLYASK